MEIKTFNFKCIGDERGKLVPIEANKDIPFHIKRIYYMFDTKNGVSRGFHAHKKLKQILICLNGSCKILMDDGSTKKIILLDEKNKGLYVGPAIWHEMFDFSKDAVLMVMASDYYNEDDYIRDYGEFLKAE